MRTGFQNACTLACWVFGALFFLDVISTGFLIVNSEIVTSRGMTSQSALELTVVLALLRDAAVLLLCWLLAYWLGLEDPRNVQVR